MRYDAEQFAEKSDEHQLSLVIYSSFSQSIHHVVLHACFVKVKWATFVKIVITDLFFAIIAWISFNVCLGWKFWMKEK